jgi:CRISPR-associated endoribonuclease Cas6
MRLKIELLAEKPVKLSVGFNEYFQALIYKYLNVDAADWLHNTGFRLEEKTFKFFTFSPFLEKASFFPKEKFFLFPQKVSFYIASPLDWILEQFAVNISKCESVEIGREFPFNNRLVVSSIDIIKEERFTNPVIKVKAITPIETHSTFRTADNLKKTHYYTPFEAEFSQMVDMNLGRKWKALFKKDCPYRLKIKPLFHGNGNERIFYFGVGEKRTLIKGWKGVYLVEGDPRFLEFGYASGLGSRNTNGCGLVELIRQGDSFRENRPPGPPAKAFDSKEDSID